MLFPYYISAISCMVQWYKYNQGLILTCLTEVTEVHYTEMTNRGQYYNSRYCSSCGANAINTHTIHRKHRKVHSVQCHTRIIWIFELCFGSLNAMRTHTEATLSHAKHKAPFHLCEQLTSLFHLSLNWNQLQFAICARKGSSGCAFWRTGDHTWSKCSAKLTDKQNNCINF